MQSTNNIDDYSFDELYKKYFRELYRFAWHYVMCDEARDIVQDVFVSFYESRSKLPPDINTMGYLLTATRNRCMNFLRRQDIIDRHENRLVEAIISWNHDTHEKDMELTREVQRCMNLLSVQQRQVIQLKSEGKTYAEIAELLNITTGTVTTHLTRAYKVFRDNFGESLLLTYFISRFL